MFQHHKLLLVGNIIVYGRALYLEAKNYVSHHQTSKHQCTCLGSAPSLNSHAMQAALLAKDESLHINFEDETS